MLRSLEGARVAGSSQLLRLGTCMALHGTLITQMRLAEALLLERDPLVGGAILAQAEPEELVARRVFEL